MVPHLSVCPISWNKIPDPTKWNVMRSLNFMKRFGDALEAIFVLSSMIGKEENVDLRFECRFQIVCEIIVPVVLSGNQDLKPVVFQKGAVSTGIKFILHRPRRGTTWCFESLKHGSGTKMFRFAL
jgi:hypothetical protein